MKQYSPIAPPFAGGTQPPYGSPGGPVFRPSSPPAYYGGWNGQSVQQVVPRPFESSLFNGNGMGPSMNSFPVPIQQSPFYSAPPSNPFPYGAVPPMALSAPPLVKPSYLGYPSYPMASSSFSGNTAMPSPSPSFPNQPLMQQYPPTMQGGPSSPMQPSAGSSYGTAPLRQQIPSSYAVSGQQSAENSLDIPPTFGVPPSQQQQQPNYSPSGPSDYSQDNSSPPMPPRQQGSQTPDFLPIYATSSLSSPLGLGSAP